VQRAASPVVPELQTKADKKRKNLLNDFPAISQNKLA
jgi:hypothetical protein